jgi:hypothetical protein
MHIRPFKLMLAFAVLGAFAATGACGDDVPMRFGRGGEGGKSGAGAAAAAGASAAGTGGGSSGAGGMLTPQQVHEDLLNAPSNGGIDVTRVPSTIYPSCQ